MASYAYTARTKSGEKATGTIDASDKRSAAQAVERMGYVPISVREGAAAAKVKPSKEGKNGKNSNGAGAASKKKKRGSSGRVAKKTDSDKESHKMGLNEMLEFTREMKDLVTSGMTLGQAIDSLRNREGGSKAQRAILDSMHDDIINGKSLSLALARHPRSFNPFYTNMVKAGEASGQLPRAFDHIITHNERIREARENVVGAMIYPAIVLILGFLAVIFLMVYVVPQFSQIFEDMNLALPGPTRILIGISNFCISIYGIVTLALMIVGGILLYSWTKTDAGKHRFHGFLLKVPVIKNIMANNAYAQFSRTLGGLMENGVGVLTALRITSDASTNVVISKELARTTDRVADGASISQTLQEGGIFPHMLTDMLAVGERSGNVPKSLNHIANRYDQQLNRSINTFSKLLEPLLLLGLAILVGFVAVAMLSAVFQISNGLDTV